MSRWYKAIYDNWQTPSWEAVRSAGLVLTAIIVFLICLCAYALI